MKTTLTKALLTKTLSMKTTLTKALLTKTLSMKTTLTKTLLTKTILTKNRAFYRDEALECVGGDLQRARHFF